MTAALPLCRLRNKKAPPAETLRKPPARQNENVPSPICRGKRGSLWGNRLPKSLVENGVKSEPDWPLPFSSISNRRRRKNSDTQSCNRLQHQQLSKDQQ